MISIKDRHEERARVIAKHGNEHAALAPCDRELKLLEALKPWRATLPAPHEGWTRDLSGWRGADDGDPPAHILSAALAAYPAPATVGEAITELIYWREREDEIDLVLDPDGCGLNYAPLDIVAEIRARSVQAMAEHDLPAKSIDDVLLRLNLYRTSRTKSAVIENALVRDLELLAQTSGGDLSKAEQITAALRADPSRADRDIARYCRCSPSTVGAIRASLGLHSNTRAVARGGKLFKMRIASAPAQIGQMAMTKYD